MEKNEKVLDKEIFEFMHSETKWHMENLVKSSERLDTKASYILGVLGIMLGIYFHLILNLNIQSITEIDGIYFQLMGILLFILIILSIGSFGRAMLHLIGIYNPRLGFNGPEPYDVYAQTMKSPTELAQIIHGHCRNMIASLEYNTLKYKQKVAIFKEALIFSLYGTGMFIILFVTYVYLISFSDSLHIINIFISCSITFIILTGIFIWKLYSLNKKSDKSIKNQCKRIITVTKDLDGELPKSKINEVKKLLKPKRGKQ